MPATNSSGIERFVFLLRAFSVSIVAFDQAPRTMGDFFLNASTKLIFHLSGRSAQDMGWLLNLNREQVNALRELPTAALARGAPRWLASRADAAQRRSAARRIGPALAGRRAIWLCVLLGGLLACWPLWTASRRPVWVLHTTATVPGVAVALILPRLVEAWW